MAGAKGHCKDINVQRHIVLLKHYQKHYIFGLLRGNTPIIIVDCPHERMNLMLRLKGRLGQHFLSPGSFLNVKGSFSLVARYPWGLVNLSSHDFSFTFKSVI